MEEIILTKEQKDAIMRKVTPPRPFDVKAVKVNITQDVETVEILCLEPTEIFDVARGDNLGWNNNRMLFFSPSDLRKWMTS